MGSSRKCSFVCSEDDEKYLKTVMDECDISNRSEAIRACIHFAYVFHSNKSALAKMKELTDKNYRRAC